MDEASDDAEAVIADKNQREVRVRHYYLISFPITNVLLKDRSVIYCFQLLKPTYNYSKYNQIGDPNPSHLQLFIIIDKTYDRTNVVPFNSYTLLGYFDIDIGLITLSNSIYGLLY